MSFFARALAPRWVAAGAPSPSPSPGSPPPAPGASSRETHSSCSQKYSQRHGSSPLATGLPRFLYSRRRTSPSVQGTPSKRTSPAPPGRRSSSGSLSGGGGVGRRRPSGGGARRANHCRWMRPVRRHCTTRRSQRCGSTVTTRPRHCRTRGRGRAGRALSTRRRGTALPLPPERDCSAGIRMPSKMGPQFSLVGITHLSLSSVPLFEDYTTFISHPYLRSSREWSRGTNTSICLSP